MLIPFINKLTHTKMSSIITEQRILIFGGTGSLGKELIKQFGTRNRIFVYSRDENKHWEMSRKYPNVNFIIGDIRDEQRVYQTLLNCDPNIIIIASAMKHIDRCEFNVREGLFTNTIGTMNVCKSIEQLSDSSLESVVFISTDKATSPTNVYGMTKSLSERIIVEYSKQPRLSNIRFVICRYGNIVNSRGSLIPKLQTTEEPVFYLTDDRMTRFVMTQEEAVKLISYAIMNGFSGETIIPKLKSIRIRDVLEVFAKARNKQIEYSAIRPGEKIHEELLNDEELRRTIERDQYYVIQPSYKSIHVSKPVIEKYSSDLFLLTQTELEGYLKELGIRM